MSSPTLGYNFLKTRWDEFDKYLIQELPALDPPLNTCTKVDLFAEALVAALQLSIEASTPRKRPSTYSKRWWSLELTELRRSVNRLRNIYRRSRHVVALAAWKEKNKEYIKAIADAKHEKWKRFVEETDGESV